MKEKTKATIFSIGLAIWFLTSIYMSINSIFGLFIETDPFIARWILSISFLWSIIMGVENKIVRDGFFNAEKTDTTENSNKPKKKTGCSSCKKK